MAYRFNLAKTIEAAGILLREAPAARMTRIRLLKLLYIADRESLRRTGRPITGDRACAMEHGPVLSTVYDCIKGSCGSLPAWERFFASDGIEVHMKEAPGVEELSRYEIETLQEVSRQRANVDEWQIVEETHAFPEWQENNPGKSSKPIPFEAILAAVGRGPQAGNILREAEASADLAKMLEGP
jgi:uncharacterized phage-associated protein